MPKYENSDPVSHSNYHDRSSHSTMELDKESQEPVLPKHLFRNRFTWSCYEICNHRLPLAIPGLCFIISWVIWKLNITYRCFPVSALISGSVIGGAIEFPFVWHLRKHRFWSTTELAQQVSELNPGLVIYKWELVCSKLNIIFYEKRIWGTPYFFFNGQHVITMFRERVLRSYLMGEFDSNNMEEIESSKIYLQSVKKTFESSLKENLPELVSELELPRDAHRNRFLSNPGYRSMTGYICVALIEWYLMKLFLQCNDLKGNLFLILYCSLFCSLGILLDSMRHLYPMMSILQGVEFLAIITKVEPKRDSDKWDEIARYMNQYLVDEEIQNSGKFFDGKHCLGFYKKYFEPLSAGKLCLEYADLIEIVKFTQSYVA